MAADHRQSAPDISQVEYIRVPWVSVRRWGARAPVHFFRSIIYHEEDYVFYCGGLGTSCVDGKEPTRISAPRPECA